MDYVLNTDRLILRPLHISDLETVHMYASDVENTTYMMRLPTVTKEETAQFLTRVSNEWKKESPSFYEFAICVDAQHIGAISIALNEERTEGELGWILHKQFWGKGYATEAAMAIKQFAMDKLKVKKLTANCDDRNRDSFQLMERIGLVLEKSNGTRTYPRTLETAGELTYSLTISEMGEQK